MIQDPAGLLQRIHELEPLCQDPGIRRAVEKGDPFAVYRALWWARLTGKLKAQRATLKLLLGTRRAFARPLKGKLFLGTFNGFGATLMGSDEAEPDGSRIAVHWVVAIFVIPVFPLGAYVVSGGARSGLSTSWNVFARVPLGLVTWAWSRGLALAVMLAVAVAGAAAFRASGHHDLTVVNGLKAAVQVSVGPASVEVRAGGTATLELPVGTWPARARLRTGREVDALELKVEAGNSTDVWNVAGVAPLFLEQVIYTKNPDPKAKPPEPTLYCSERHVRVTGVDDAFKEPPKEVSMGKGQDRVVRRRLDVVQEAKLDGAQLCAFLLGDQKRYAEAARVAEVRALATGWTEEEADFAVGFALLAGRADLERVARTYYAARPADLDAARTYQNTVDTGDDQHAALVEEFRKAAGAAPGDPKAQYLYVRLLDGPAMRTSAEAALARFPKDPDLVRLAVALRAEDGAFAEAIGAYRTLVEVAPLETGRVLEEMSTSLVALNRREEAGKELAQAFGRLQGPSRVEAAVLHVRVAAPYTRGPNETLVATWEKTLGGEKPNLHFRTLCGHPVDLAALKGADAVYAALRRDPAGALRLAKGLEPAELARLETEAWALAYFEAVRTGDPVASKLADGHMYGLRQRPALLAWVRGGPGAPPATLQLPVRAAARFVRSRVPEIDPRERKQLLAAARADDRLGGLVSQALAAWPPATR